MSVIVLREHKKGTRTHHTHTFHTHTHTDTGKTTVEEKSQKRLLWNTLKYIYTGKTKSKHNKQNGGKNKQTNKTKRNEKPVESRKYKNKHSL